MKIEKWVFTLNDLKNPKLCKNNDEFVAWNNALPEVGVLVKRNGEITNKYGDGTIGVTKDHELIARVLETLYSIQNKDEADIWRDVMVDEDGYFVAFKQL